MSLDLEKAADEQLMLAYQQGDQRAFDVLYRRHSNKVYGFLRARVREGGLVDDLFQATFMKLHQTRGIYDPAFPFVPWLFTVCRSVLIDSARKSKRAREDLDEGALENAPAPERPDQGGLAALQGLDHLQPEQREAIELRFGADFSFEEIAARLETSPANARQLVSRAVRKLKSLAGKGGDRK